MVTAKEHAAVLAENALLKQQLNHAKELHAAAEAKAAESHALLAVKRTQEDDYPTAKKARLGRDFAPPLEDDDVLDTVLSFVGVDEYFYAAAVSRRWRGRYIRLCYTMAAQEPLSTRPKLRTSYRSAVTTVAKLQLALDTTLSVRHLRTAANVFAKEAVRYSLAPVEILSLMRALYCPLDGAAAHAARINKLEVLQWLHSSGFLPFKKSVLLAAARGGSAALLQWLCSHTDPWSQQRKRKMLWCAGLKSNLSAMQYLREQGAEWPKRFYGEDPCNLIRDCWSTEVSLGCLFGSTLLSAGSRGGRLVPCSIQCTCVSVFALAHGLTL
jgi:hypothetical protein